MTRTARSASIKAMLRDRSESKSGLDKSLRKNGGGQHNWGSIDDERELEFAAMHDEEAEFDQEVDDETRSEDSDELKKPAMSPRTPSDKDVQSARQFRKNALKKGGVDLAAIARTSAAVTPTINKSSPVSSETYISAVEPVPAPI